ncbi:MAG: sigma-54-dependent Fis family transcriptional regulator [Armatimonadetes bacterium]|nr:sigma-54-dependent Fis family transcriptional regulator [Armatimonadota bacterium]
MKEKKKLLIVDDEPNIRRILQVAFEKAGYLVTVAADGFEAQKCLIEAPFDVVLTDVTMPGLTGYELLRHVKERQPFCAVVIMTAFGTIPQAVQAIRDGAYEYVPKPFDLDRLKRIVGAAVSEAGGSSAPSKPRSKSKSSAGKSLIAASPAMQEILATIEQVADSKATVLVTGESGVGKEVIAQSLHSMSSRATNPFVAVSCAALPDTLLESELFGYEKGAFTGANGSKIGRFELAEKGTLFLDEIGEISMQTQVKMLRVLQEREFERLGSTTPTKIDVRLVTATNRDLNLAVEEGIFRLDLLYRLQVIEIHIPPLRERKEDIIPLAEHFLAKFGADNQRDALKVSDEAMKVMLDYAWPGNVRELENAMERATVLTPDSEPELLAKVLPKPSLRAA